MRVLVTGASGMLGGAVARALAARGDDVTVMQRRSLTEAARGGHDLREALGDVADPAAAARALRGADAVIHLAAKVDMTGPWEDFRRANIEGTAVLVEAARDAGVSRFVFVSSPSVAHAGHSLVGVGAEPADPEGARGSYARSKAAAELLALDADARDWFPVVAVRPHIVWGPGDPQLVARIARRARSGRLPIIGSGAPLVDTTYLDNAVDALVAALDRCEPARGEAFVVTNGEPRPIVEFLHGIATAAGAPGPSRHVPASLARGAGALVDVVTAARVRLHHDLGGDPPLTRFLAEQLSTAHWFDLQRTRDALQWTPRVSVDEGFARLREAMHDRPGA